MLLACECCLLSGSWQDAVCPSCCPEPWRAAGARSRPSKVTAAKTARQSCHSPCTPLPVPSTEPELHALSSSSSHVPSLIYFCPLPLGSCLPTRAGTWLLKHQNSFKTQLPPKQVQERECRGRGISLLFKVYFWDYFPLPATLIPTTPSPKGQAAQVRPAGRCAASRCSC